jgi:hypothetical protein
VNRHNFLPKRQFSKTKTGLIIATVLAEKGCPSGKVFVFVQGITALARSKPQHDAQEVMEGKARVLLEKVL